MIHELQNFRIYVTPNCLFSLVFFYHPSNDTYKCFPSFCIVTFRIATTSRILLKFDDNLVHAVFVTTYQKNSLEQFSKFYIQMKKIKCLASIYKEGVIYFS